MYLDNFLISAGVIIPLFFIIFLGYFLKRLGIIKQPFALEANKICFHVFLPCLLFYNIYTADIYSAFDGKLLLFTLISLTILFIFIWISVVVFCKDNRKRGVMIQGIYRSNFVILGLPIATNLFGNACFAVIGLMLAIVLPLYNIFSVIALEVFANRYQREETGQGELQQWKTVKKVLRQIITTPLIIATILALFLVLSRIQLPEILLQPIANLAAAATPLALMILGAFLSFSSITDHFKELLSAVFARLILIPAVMLLIAVQLGFTGVELAALMAVFATPAATAGFTMVQIMGGDEQLAANIVVFTSFISMFTLFVFTYLLIQAGLLI